MPVCTWILVSSYVILLTLFTLCLQRVSEHVLIHMLLAGLFSNIFQDNDPHCLIDCMISPLSSLHCFPPTSTATCFEISMGTRANRLLCVMQFLLLQRCTVISYSPTALRLVKPGEVKINKPDLKQSDTSFILDSSVHRCMCMCNFSTWANITVTDRIPVPIQKKSLLFSKGVKWSIRYSLPVSV